MAGRIWVEAWAPEYGASYEVANGLAPTEEEVAPGVEVDPGDWAPVTPRPSDSPPFAFVDGVSRVEARAFLDAGPLVVPGLCGSVGIGSVMAGDHTAGFGPHEIRRAAVFGSGASAEMPAISPDLAYEARSVPGARPEELRHGLEGVRESVEAEISKTLARQGRFVIVDGPLRVLEPLEITGFIKSHQKAYLPAQLEPVIRRLAPGQRTPVFQFGVLRARYSWYVRLAVAEGQHPWAAVARCEVSCSLSLERARRIADVTTYHLPRFASKPHWDPRAPQNLVPVAALEARMRRLLGERELVYRKIRSALHSRAA